MLPDGGTAASCRLPTVPGTHIFKAVKTLQGELACKEGTVIMARDDWSVLRCSSGSEYLAESELARLDLHPYLPQYRRYWIPSGARSYVPRRWPLFSGYLFIPHTEIDRTRLRLCRGLAREDMILSDPLGRPLRVRAGVIAELRVHEQAGMFDEQPAEAHRPGSIAAVRSGPCAGMEVLVAAVRSRTALQVLTPLFGGARATVAARDVAAA